MLRGGVVSFTGAGVNEWQKFFEDKATGPKRDTISALEYNTSLQNYYIISAFRRICGNLRDGAAVLDAGCGNGLFWREFLAPRSVVGVDYSLRMCELAEAKGMTAHQADIMKLPFADEQFDLVYCAEIIQYIEDLPALLKEFSRVCRRGGQIVISTINRNCLLQRSVRSIRLVLPREDMPRSFRYFTRTANEIVASAHGLSLAVGTVAWTHFPIPWLHRSKSPKRRMEWLAWNVFVEFCKPTDPT
jgi:ubiquinone/menaquinone biosynthesis C-methylase UbiE